MMASIKLSSKQTQAWRLLSDDTTLYVGYGGGAFSGKSYLMCYWLVYMCRVYEGTAWGLARKELVTLKKTTLVTLFKVLGEIGFRVDDHYIYNQQLNTLTFINSQTDVSKNSTIYLIDTAHKPSDPLFERFGGLELTGCAVDESGETSKKAIDILFTRLGRKLNDHYGISKKMLECFNPSKTHVYERYYKPWTEGKETVSTKFVRALPEDNPSPDVKAYVRDILLTGEQPTIQRLIYGNFDYDENPYSLLDYSTICNLYTNLFIEKTKDKYISADIAYLGGDLFVITVWAGLVIEKIEAIDKIDETAIGLKIIEMAKQYQVPYSNIVYDADGLRKFTANSLKKLTNAKPFVNNSRPIKGSNFGNLKTECAFKLKELMESNQILIEDLNFKSQIMADLGAIMREPTNDELKIKLEKKSAHKLRTGKSPDFFDSILMRMYFELRSKKGWA